MAKKSQEELEQEIFVLDTEIKEKDIQLSLLKKELAFLEVQEYTFEFIDGTITLSELFHDKEDLIVIHNMGKHCAYCTMWADGFNGVLPHIQDRTSFVVISPNSPVIQKEFSDSRGWKFSMVSAQSSTFIKDMGFELEDGKYMPGVSFFHKDNKGKIIRTGKDFFGPGDVYSSPWQLFKFLKRGINNWSPKLSY
ncbi:MAG: DUF899 family protein [Candidatus Hodarchaeales archaeon]